MDTNNFLLIGIHFSFSHFIYEKISKIIFMFLLRFIYCDSYRSDCIFWLWNRGGFIIEFIHVITNTFFSRNYINDLFDQAQAS